MRWTAVWDKGGYYRTEGNKMANEILKAKRLSEGRDVDVIFDAKWFATFVQRNERRLNSGSDARSTLQCRISILECKLIETLGLPHSCSFIILDCNRNWWGHCRLLLTFFDVAQLRLQSHSFFSSGNKRCRWFSTMNGFYCRLGAHYTASNGYCIIYIIFHFEFSLHRIYQRVII